MNLNKVLIAGNLTRDPEVRFTPSGRAVAEMGMAINREWNRDGEAKKEVTFVSVTVWGKEAEACGKYLHKGSNVFVEGRLQFETWEKNGEKRSTLKITAERVHFLSKSEAAQGGDEGEQAQKPAPAKELENDDIPF